MGLLHEPDLVSRERLRAGSSGWEMLKKHKHCRTNMGWLSQPADALSSGWISDFAENGFVR